MQIVDLCVFTSKGNFRKITLISHERKKTRKELTWRNRAKKKTLENIFWNIATILYNVWTSCKKFLDDLKFTITGNDSYKSFVPFQHYRRMSPSPLKSCNSICTTLSNVFNTFSNVIQYRKSIDTVRGKFHDIKAYSPYVCVCFSFATISLSALSTRDNKIHKY